MRYRGLLCDLDGVVYRGRTACEGAIEGLTSARHAGLPILFLTNNAARLPGEVASHLTSIGFPAEPDEVLNSSQVAARYLHEHLTVPEGRFVLPVGGPGVTAALDEQGIPVVAPSEVLRRGGSDIVSAVVQGYGASVDWAELAEAAYAISAGAYWVATNTDATLPTERGQAPGNGSMVAAVAHAVGRQPDLVTGKPNAPAFEVALERLGLPAQHVLMIGDRLDTDIAGARRAGLDTALVLTGVHGRADVERADVTHQPDLVSENILGLVRHWSSNS